MYNNDTQVANYVKKIDRRKVAVTAGAIGVGIVLTVATGGLGAPVAMAIGGAASGAIISGYDAYSTGQRGWALAGSTLKGAGLGAIAGFIGGQFIGAGANVAANVTQNIANQTVRHVAKAGVEAGVETVIDTGISVATGNPISLKNVVTDYGLNLVTNGSGSVSSKKSAKADVPMNKPKSGDVAVTKSRQSATPVQQLSNPGPNKSRIPVEAVDGNGNKVYGEILEPGYIHTRPVKDVTSTSSNTSTSQKLISGPDPNAPRLEAPVSEPIVDSSHSLHSRGYKPQPGERTFEGYVKNNVSTDAEVNLYASSAGFNSNNGNIGGQFNRFGSDSHAGLSPHVHQPQRNVTPTGDIYGGVGSKTSNGGITSPGSKDVQTLASTVKQNQPKKVNITSDYKQHLADTIAQNNKDISACQKQIEELHQLIDEKKIQNKKLQAISVAIDDL